MAAAGWGVSELFRAPEGPGHMLTLLGMSLDSPDGRDDREGCEVRKETGQALNHGDISERLCQKRMTWPSHILVNPAPA